MTVILVAVWMFVGAAHVRAVWRKKILWPGRDEDHDQWVPRSNYDKLLRKVAEIGAVLALLQQPAALLATTQAKHHAAT